MPLTAPSARAARYQAKFASRRSSVGTRLRYAPSGSVAVAVVAGAGSRTRTSATNDRSRHAAPYRKQSA